MAPPAAAVGVSMLRATTKLHSSGKGSRHSHQKEAPSTQVTKSVLIVHQRTSVLEVESMDDNGKQDCHPTPVDDEFVQYLTTLPDRPDGMYMRMTLDTMKEPPLTDMAYWEWREMADRASGCSISPPSEMMSAIEDEQDFELFYPERASTQLSQSKEKHNHGKSLPATVCLIQPLTGVSML